MAFKMADNPTFGMRVDVDDLNDAGVIEKSHFLATFKRYTVAELETLRARWLSEGKDDPIWVAREVLVGWKGVQNEDGSVAEFNETNKAKLLSYPPVVAALQQTFWDNVIKTRAKN